MGLMSPVDSMFLIPESREQPMHVGSLQLFELPEGADRALIRETYESMLTMTDVAPLFRRRPYRSLTTAGQWAWVDDEEIDLEHHVRHSALPEPGRVRELLALVSRLHGTLLDRQRPMWEMHVIEGLDKNRFAVYSKLHHSVMDGVSGLRLLQRTLSDSPDELTTPAFWAPRKRRGGSSSNGGSGGGLGSLMSVPTAAARGALDLIGLAPKVLRMAEQGIREQATMLPLQAPRSMLNVPITGARRFAAQSWSLDTIRAVGKSSGTSVNDVVLAMCAGALRAYMLELGALPDAPLVAMTPVSLRREDTGDDAGNAVGTILCNLATDKADAADRLAAIHASMQQGKEMFGGLNQLQATAVSAAMMMPLLLSMAPGGLSRLTPPPYNLVISNVPGPQQPLYFNGARLQGVYPLSIPTTGQALNITVTSYAGSMEFGLIGCRRSVPHLQRLLTLLDDSLEELAKLTGV